MEATEFALEYLSLVKEPIPDNFIDVEDCGIYSTDMRGYHLVFNKEDTERVYGFYKTIGSSRENFFDNFLIGPVEILQYTARQRKSSYSMLLMDSYGSADGIFKAFGVQTVPSISQGIPISELDDILSSSNDGGSVLDNDVLETNPIVSESVLEESKENTSPVSVESPVLERGDEFKVQSDLVPSAEEQPNHKDEVLVGNDEVVGGSAEEILKAVDPELISQTNSNTLDQEDKPVSEDPLLEGLESPSSEESFNVLEDSDDTIPENTEGVKSEEESDMVKDDVNSTEGEVYSQPSKVLAESTLEPISSIQQLVTNTNRAKEQMEEMVLMLTGRKSTPYTKLSKEDFDVAMQGLFEDIPKEELAKAFKIALNRFWRFGEVEIVSRFLEEVLLYFEELN